MEPGRWDSACPRTSSPTGSRSCARRPARRCRRTGRWARWAAWSPAGSPGSSGSAARASRSPATRPPGSRRWPIAVDWLRSRRARRGDRRRGRLRRRRSGGPRAAAAREPIIPTAADAAVGLVLKRLDDARRDGDRVYAVIRDIVTSTERARERVGDSGAATGLAAVVGTAAGLDDRICQRPSRIAASSAIGARPGPVLARESRRGPAPRGRRGPRSGVEDGTSRASRKPRLRTRGRASSTRLAPPAGLRRSGLFAIEGGRRGGDPERIRELRDSCRRISASRIDAMARRWWHRHPVDPRLPRGWRSSPTASIRSKSPGHREQDRDRSGSDDSPVERVRSTARRRAARRRFRLPGTGQLFRGDGPRAGRPLARGPSPPGDGESTPPRPARAGRLVERRLPAAVRRPSRRRSSARSPSAVWSPTSCSDLGIVPDAAIGYSMGESAALVALRAWTDRDEMTGRLRSSPLFATELAGPCDAARRAWGIPPDEPVDWVAGIVPAVGRRRPRGDRRRRVGRVYVLIRNTATRRSSAASGPPSSDVVRALGCRARRAAGREHRALRDRPARRAGLPGLARHRDGGAAGDRFLQWRLGRAYTGRSPVRRRGDRGAGLAADRLSRTIENAYADGIGLFIEVGPGAPAPG